MNIAIPAEIMQNEGRVAATPESVGRYVAAGLRVRVQSGAGRHSHFSDEAYRAAGAETSDDVAALWQWADVVLKVKEPLFNQQLGRHEAELLRPGSTLITFLHPANNIDTVRLLQSREISAISMDCIPRSDEGWPMDALSSMSIIAGYRAVALAANLLPQMFCGAQSGGGSVGAANVLVIGAGMVGMQSIRSAVGLGAKVFAVDVSSAARERAVAAGAEVVGFDLPAAGSSAADGGNGGGGAAVPGAELLELERGELARLLPRMDVVISGILILGEHAPVLMTAEMVRRQMKAGAVIVDVAIDQGGNCELSRRGQTYVDEASGVTVSAIMNLPGQVPAHSTMLYSQNVCNLVLDAWRPGAGEGGAGAFDFERPVVKAATVVRGGRILHEGTLHAMQAAGER